MAYRQVRLGKVSYGVSLPLSFGGGREVKVLYSMECDVPTLFYICYLQGMQQHYRGQVDQAVRTTSSAKKWTICGIVSGVIYVCTIIFLVIVCYALGFGLAFGLADFDATTPTPTPRF